MKYILITIIIVFNIFLVFDFAKSQTNNLSYIESVHVGNMNPYDNVSFRGNNIRFFTLIFEGLFMYDHTNELHKPVLAEGITAQRNNQYIIHLKKDVYWHDGEKFTAADVVSTYNYIMNNSQLITLRNYFNNSISSIDKRSDYEVVIRLRSHFQQDPKILLTTWILPKHYLDGTTRDRRQFSNAPVGTGPYKFESRNLQGIANLSLNTSHHVNEAVIKNIRMDVIPDPDSALLRVLSLNSDALIELKSYQVDQVRDSPHTIASFQSYGIHAIGFNFRNEIFNDTRVRQAMVHGFDRFRALESWFDGQGTVIAGPFSPGAHFYDPNLRPKEFNLSKSKDLLRDAGFRDLNRDGYLQDRDGNRLSFELLINNNIQESSKAMVFVIEQFQSEMKELGIEIKTRYVVQDIYDRILFNEWDFDLAVLEWTFDPTYDISQLFHSDNIGPGGNNVIAYDNVLVSELFNEFRTTQDTLRRFEIMNTVQNILSSEAPYIFMFNIERNALIHNRFISTRIDPFNFFGFIDEWRILEGFD